MIATAPAQAEVTLAAAITLYGVATHAIRDRHNPLPGANVRAENWEIATATVVAGLAEWEATAVLRYLIGRELLAMPDVVLARTLAARLGVKVKFERKGLE